MDQSKIAKIISCVTFAAHTPPWTSLFMVWREQAPRCKYGRACGHVPTQLSWGTLIYDFHTIVTSHEVFFQLFGNIKSHGQYLTSGCSLIRLSVVFRSKTEAWWKRACLDHLRLFLPRVSAYPTTKELPVCQPGSCSDHGYPDAHLQSEPQVGHSTADHLSTPPKCTHVQLAPRDSKAKNTDFHPTLIGLV